MEELLLSVIKEANGCKASQIKSAAQEAYDLLGSQHSLLRTPSFELRAACFQPIKLCLESKRNKLLTLGLSGLGKIIRDERFQAGSEPEDDSLWLPTQLLHATSSMLAQCEDTQVHILRCVLSMACGVSWALNGRLVMLIVGRCGEAYENGTQPVRAAAQAAASQTLTAFCTFLDDECQEIQQQQQKHKNSGSSAEMVYNKTSAVACFNEAIPVMQYICSRLEELKTFPKSGDMIVFLLECLLTLVSTLPQSVHSNVHFTTFLWQRFCPALLALLGAPTGAASSEQGLNNQQCKIVYSVGIQVVRLVGRERTLRPVLEALFHRMLLLPSPGKRLEPLRAAKELLRSPGRIADLLLLSGPIIRHAGDDMAIIRLIMDSIEESAQYSDTNVLLASVECVCALLSSLEVLSKGESVSSEDVSVTNCRYPNLEQADYTGPLTYQSLARLPKPYRDVVANLKYQSDSDSSGIDGGNPDLDIGSETDTSGATEGPEECASQSDDSIMDDESFLTNQQLQKLHNLPKQLNFGRSGIEECNTDMERHNARHFVKTLQNILLPNILSLRSSIQIDEVLQEFASKCCQHNSAQNYEIVTIMNADGIYLATYAALLLNLRLIRNGHYVQKSNAESSTPLMTESQFVEEVHGSGALVYVSATWLCELYQNVLAKSFLELAGYDPSNPQQPALISLLTDVGGLGQSQLLTDWLRLEKVQKAPDHSPEIEAGLKLARRVLTCCWSSVVAVLGASLGEVPPSSSGSALSRLVARRSRQKYKQRLRDDVITASLEGLQKAAALSNTLKLQSRSSSILALLSSSSCQIQGPKILASHALSLDVLISKGLALGSHSAACWPHIFNGCVAVASLEHALFSKTGSAQLLLVAQNAQNQVTSSTCGNSSDKTLSSTVADEETCVDVYSFLQNSTFGNKQNEASIGEIVERSGVLNTRGKGIMSGVNAAKVCCVLSSKADELFHNAALKLSMPGLCSFLTQLCKVSQSQIFSVRSNKDLPAEKKWWRKDLKDQYDRSPGTLLLHRIGEVTLKCIHSGRPLIHTMKLWSIVGPHFMQAACHKDRAINKKAIACIHDAVNALLSEQTEMAHFHFNEALFKPFENLLCLELCDADVQDQIVASLCEFVEANRTEISSGWRPLFGTLRVANARNNATSILDVFYVFLQTDNTLVFANAALDYILCLLTHIRQDLSESVKDPVGSDTDLCAESLKLLKSCASILSMMHNMPKCPQFNLTHKMSIETEPQLVDCNLESDLVHFGDQHHRSGEEITYEVLDMRPEMEQIEARGLTLTKMDPKCGSLKVWYILLEGLSTAAVSAPKKNQPLIVEAFFKLLKDLQVNPGLNFGLYCINHLVLPMVQNWLRQNSKSSSTDDWQHFKHCCGLASELVVEYLTKNNEHPAINLALKQLLIVLIECVSQPNESVARLGASCMRHIVVTIGQTLTSNQWLVLVSALHRACLISLNPLRQITLAFKKESESFFGDNAAVKVAARKDTTVCESERLYEMAQQVFLMQSQRNCAKCPGKLCECERSVAIDERSYVFLLYPLDSDEFSVRIPFRNLVVGILAHQMLVQTISSALLQNLHHVTPILKILHITTGSLRGVLTHVNARHVYVLLDCLEVSNFRSREFDQRPGLKFLTQKVGNLSKAANLYTQTNTSEVVQIIVLMELCLDGIEKYQIGSEDIKLLLGKEARAKCYTDLDFVEKFLRDLRVKWEHLCETYTSLTLNIPANEEEDQEEDEQDVKTPTQVKDGGEDVLETWENSIKPYKFTDYKKADSFVSSDSESYLEKEVLPSDIPTDDETNEMAAKMHSTAISSNEKIRYDTNTLLQMKLRPNNSCENLLPKLDEKFLRPAPLQTTRTNPFNSLPQPQAVPPEIQQQRSMSIFRDLEDYKSSRIETMEACLELLSSLSSDKLVPLAVLLKDGAVMLLSSHDEKIKVSAENLLRRMNGSSKTYEL